MSQFNNNSGSGDSSDSVQNLSVSQLQELQGVLRNPVSGRQVMIPLTSKAFVIGSLQPEIDSSGDETLYIRGSDQGSREYKAIPRKVLYETLEREKKLKKEPSKKKLPQAAKVEKKRKPEAGNPAAASSTKKEQIPPRETQTPSAGTSLPFFEIKEEIDGSGRVLRSETVNVTKQLELVANELQDPHGESKDAMDGTEPEHDAVISMDYVEDELDNKQPVTDQDFEALSTRLDELARLEEEAEAKSAENLSSAIKLQGKSWSKGFLGGKSAKRLAKPKQQQMQPNDLKIRSKVGTTEALPKQQIKKGTDKGWSKGFLNSSPKPAKAAAPRNELPLSSESKPSAPKTDDERSRRVSFQSNAEVKEIPRIGTQSVASLKKAPPPTPISSDPVINKPVPTRTFDSSVFTGVVKERPVGKSTNQQDNKPKKKLSKFAQERMQNK